jgi:hypothetical protein
MKRPGMIRRGIEYNTLALFVLWSLAFSIPTCCFGWNQDAGNARAEYAPTREEIRGFEDVINGIIANDVSSSSYALVNKPKAVYLQGYGVSCTFLINIHRAVINTPFGQVRPRNTVSLEEKIRRIEELKAKLIPILQDSGSNFQQLRKEERVAIVAFVEDRNFPGEPNASKTIVMSALKKDLDELGHKVDRAKEFKQRMKIVEY